ncbi:hypothetical protein LAV84_23770 [Rhizobium sp. VS19-DR104.2]|uniref:hypothetical protein n=1 Tax=unclassified Rhizobium TaxID=2613769 RepID=UPI001CC5B976|nr:MULTISPECIES: hypothetical protein [unclassified Rhizobium]MBZ5762278.1 hypothetical protein [Rhizobium sp. VS19-DR96]MBZ5768294.1 hypothetical protein [Rhizobium sp. VS19-DR129.2]MBZ5775834.1 hypothetical protein [Rhizobium sp. VS19-DRK62.2]MBZ5787145.1 hypothetical protein [Rhizobium sp. VS19-DR121]MBZ5804220.1 hypothetical protein [Rhizobium sp. VS19-DR181]
MDSGAWAMEMHSDPIRRFTDAAYNMADQRQGMDADEYAEQKSGLVMLRRKVIELLDEDQRIRFEEISLALLNHLLEISPAEVSAIESQNGPSSHGDRLDRPH